MFGATEYWITIAETKGFSADAAMVFSLAEFEAFTQCLSVSPTLGDIIPGTGGVRRFSCPAASQGRNGRARVLYYFHDLNVPVFLLAVYRRGESLRLSSADKRMIRSLVDELVASYGDRREASHSLRDGAA